MIYHMTKRADWENAQHSGEYHAESLTTQGFIHFSTKDQIVKVANAIYQGQTGLVILCVEESKLNADLRYEPPDTNIPAQHYTGEVFPHLYGVLNVDAVSTVIEFAPDAGGTFTLPENLPV